MVYSDSQSGMQRMAAEIGGSRAMHHNIRKKIIAGIQEDPRYSSWGISLRLSRNS